MKALAFVLVLALTATAGAQQYALPDNRLTPGDVLPVTAAQVCARGYARQARHPYDDDWRRLRVAMFREYEIPHARWSEYAVDHLVPIEDGGNPFDRKKAPCSCHSASPALGGW